MTEASITELRPPSVKGGETRRPKDPTSAQRQARYRKKRKAVVTVAPSASPVPIAHPPLHKRRVKDIPPVTVPRNGSAIDMAAYAAAVALAGAAAFFSVKGMVTLFPGAPLAIVGMAATMETAKLVAAGWLARRWWVTAWVWRFVLVALVAGLALINAAGVYAQLVAAHVGERGAATSAIETQTADIEAKISVQGHNVADPDRRLGQIDSAVKRGRTHAALSAIEAQKKARAALADERKREAGTLAALKAERASVTAKGRQIETEAAPIRYVAELLGADADSERAIRWLILMMVLCCDPLAIALTAAASAKQ
jgi:hypothetical protein